MTDPRRGSCETNDVRRQDERGADDGAGQWNLLTAADRQPMTPSVCVDAFVLVGGFVDRAKDRLILVARKRYRRRSVGSDLATLQPRASGIFGNAPLRRPAPVVHDAKVPGYPLEEQVHIVGPGLTPQVQQARSDAQLENIGANR